MDIQKTIYILVISCSAYSRSLALPFHADPVNNLSRRRNSSNSSNLFFFFCFIQVKSFLDPELRAGPDFESPALAAAGEDESVTSQLPAP